MNNGVIAGRLCADPEVSDKRISFCLVDNCFKEPQFLNIISFDVDKLNEKALKKGDMVWVEGKLQVKKFEGKIYASILAKNVSILSRKFTGQLQEEVPEEDIPF